MDGVPFQRRDGLVAFYVYNLATQVRHLVAVVRKSAMCTCGCLAWCTLAPIFFWLQWSFRALAVGMAPDRRHDGRPFGDEETARANRAGTQLPKCVLLQIKGDWAEFSHTFGLPSWSSNLHPCFCCSATKDTLMEVGQTSPLSGPSPSTVHGEYGEACRHCEVRARIPDRRTLQILVGLLHYDKQRGGSKGRALQEGVPALGLLAGDRLEPQPDLLNVADFEQLQVPVEVLFWRPANQTLALHRNPLFTDELGVSVQTLALDCLHVLHLGVFNVFCCHALWALLEADVWRTGTTGETLLQLGVMRCRHELFAWYAEQERANPTARVYRLQDLTWKMLGTRAHKHLATKGAETGTLLQYVALAVRTHKAKLGAAGPALAGAGESLVSLLAALRDYPACLSPAMTQTMVDAAKRAFVLAGQAGVPRTPKWHLMLHVVAKASFSGNPYFHTTFVDEGFNGRLAKLARNAHRLNWHRRVLGHFRWAFTKQADQRRRLG